MKGFLVGLLTGLAIYYAVANKPKWLTDLIGKVRAKIGF